MSGPAQSPFDQEPLVEQPEAVCNTTAAQVEKSKATAAVNAECVARAHTCIHTYGFDINRAPSVTIYVYHFSL